MEKIVQVSFAKKLAEKLWAKNKYSIMSRNYRYYKEIVTLYRNIESEKDIKAISEAFTRIQAFPFERHAFINTSEHVWGYFKKSATLTEKESFFDTLAMCQALNTHFYCFPAEAKRVISYISQLLVNYPNEYISQSTFVIGEAHWNILSYKKKRYILKNGAFYILSRCKRP